MKTKQVVLPILVIVAGFGIAALLIATGPKLQPKAAENIAPLVRVVPAIPKTIRLSTFTHGTVVPRTESELVPEVSGRVVQVSQSLVSGGFFNKGDVLLSIDPLDYDVALKQARAGLARASSDLDNARRTYNRQQDLVRRQATSDSQRDDALNRVHIAQATLQEANAVLSRARRDLDRTQVIAPYDGRVRSEQVDVGQFVSRGVSVATIYAVDFAEVRLPIQDEELAFLDLQLLPGQEQLKATVPVVLRAKFAGAMHEWSGEVVRTEGELDPNTRMVNVVARVPAPYANHNGRPPLSVGLFVDVEIKGATVDNLVVLPRAALRANDQVLIVDAENQLRYRNVTVLRLASDKVYISAGLSAGDRICVSNLQSAAEGMLVRILDPSDQANSVVLSKQDHTREAGS